MDEFLSLCEAEEGEESLVESSDSYVTAPSECSMNRTEDLDSFMSAQSILLTPSGGSANVSGVSSHHDKTLTEMSIQERIQQLEEEKNRLIQQARETVFGSNPQGDTSKEKPVDNSSLKSDGAVQRTGFQLTQLNFESAPATNEPSTSKPSIDLGSDSDDEMMDHKRDLSESGKHIQKQLQKQERERATPWETLPSSGAADTTKKKPKENVLTGVSKKPKESVAPTLFDNFFRFNIRNPKISSSTFECYTDGHKRVRLSDVRPATVPSADSWVTGGVVVARDVRKSANGKDYLIWKLHDLKDCQQPPVTLLLFGEAFKEYWKLQAGICVALMSPQLADTEKNAGPDKFKPKSSKVTLKVFKPAQVVELGYSSDLGTCKGVKLDGQRCSNFVNTSLSEFCVHHVMKEVRKLAANRGTFNSLTSLPPLKKPVNRLHNTTKSGLPATSCSNLTSTIRPTQANQIAASSTLKPTTRSEENETLKEIMSSRAHTLGARNMMSLAELKKGGGKESVSAEVKSSMADFIKGQISSSSTSTVRPTPKLHAPQLGFGLNGAKNITLDVNTTTKPAPSSHDPAKLRAIAILKRSKEHSGSNTKATKRTNVSEDQAETGAKRSKLGTLDNKVDLDALMKRKSIHDSEANKAQGIMVQQHLDGLEAREKVETFVTECMSVKDVKVVSCKKCGYTAPRQSELCMREGHAVKRSTAEKRFFKCGSCKKRTVVYSMMPTKPCQHCEANEWIRVAMKDERKVVLENERLMVRGEERKFVNT